MTGFTVTPPPSGFDLAVRTQADFDALLATDDWYGASTVAFVGDGGNLKFTRTDGLGVKIPQNVKFVQGFNDTIFSISNFKRDATSNRAAIWYESTQSQIADYHIDAVTVMIDSTISEVRGFENCLNISRCMVKGSCGFQDAESVGYYNCYYLDNCYALLWSTCYKPFSVPGSGSIGYSNCHYMDHCRAEITKSYPARGYHACQVLNECFINNPYVGCHDHIAFSNCNRLSNCIADIQGYGQVTAYDSCTQLVNCIGSAEHNTNTSVVFSGDADKSQYGYGFKNCSYLSNCNQSNNSSTAGFLGGANTHVDTVTVAAV